ncbi:hypothetical protein ACV970_004585 [Vibrio parahaemolyticus]|uniref:hypothetical protein n=1 Tax=Vibrio parahaemolyticus TaxID=670 RepID=UPI0007A070D8|nr:hypothetical protein [Vibrio parahaemolyticus]EGQ8399441.1 hypothetical protein [Vibrio parahaemolyticus]EGQ9147770.1 hypothetical protein [Vibrio parahaemolyticus]EGR0987896.1 hypothetical protein [Vibrio parahaemolyticus]EGR1374217.1 hypothetical protein [Vibrio parahaemolyticus]EHY8973413.1 hypothetical protein [Vibrio parahaemolyticus]
MKKYLLIHVLMLSFNAFAEVTEEDVTVMRKEVKGMTKEEVIAKHIELFEAVKADPSENNCDAFGAFDTASRNEKKISMMNFDAQDRLFSAQDNCGVIVF